VSGLADVPLRAKTGEMQAVIETPRASRIKFAYDPATGLFRAKRVLALGLWFPFPFGFLPSTKGEDGDPLDVMVMTELALPTGCLVHVGMIGVIKVEQEEAGRRFRNDRFLAAPYVDGAIAKPRSLSDIDEPTLSELETFFVAYEAEAGKTIQLLGRGNQSEAEALVTQPEGEGGKTKHGS
jgi:inorganic pyrophosphatase